MFNFATEILFICRYYPSYSIFEYSQVNSQAVSGCILDNCADSEVSLS